MADSVHMLKNLSLSDLVKCETEDSYTIIRNGSDFGVFVKIGATYHFQDNRNKAWVCQCTDIDTRAECIAEAVAFMSY